MRKMLKGLGILGALIAAEATIRLSNLARAFGGGDAGIYFLITLVAVAVAGVLLMSFAKPIKGWIKWTMLVSAALSVAILMLAPSFGAVWDTIMGLALALIGLISIEKFTLEGDNA